MIQNTFSQNLAAPVPDVPEPAKTDDSAAKISGIALFKRTNETSCIYRNIITPLMDLTTVEHNLWAGKYDVEKFADVCRVAPNIERILI
ncbi:unnamed protein product [Rhizophagus irregularis]|nr:unnamed protein product [Rhizophagus irregularis]CAB5318674.1 unnamed protein product [Rhizophagus irregularis]